LETAIGLPKEFGHPEIAAFADDLREKLPQLLAPLEWLEQHLRPALKDRDADTQAFILWSWQYRQELNLDIATDISEGLRAVASAAWDLLGLFHRSSSLAESLHSWLRPYLQIHRGMSRGGCCLCCNSSGTTTCSSGASGQDTARWNWQG